ELDALPDRPAGEGKEPGSQSGGGSPEKATPASRAGKSRSRPLPKPQDEKLVPVDRRITAPEIPSLKNPQPPADAKGRPLGVKRAVVVLRGGGRGGGGAAPLLKPPPDVQPPPAPVVGKPIAEEPPQAAPAADEVTVTLRTNPEGAAVLEDGVMIGKTPL